MRIAIGPSRGRQPAFSAWRRSGCSALVHAQRRPALSIAVRSALLRSDSLPHALAAVVDAAPMMRIVNPARADLRSKVRVEGRSIDDDVLVTMNDRCMPSVPIECTE